MASSSAGESVSKTRSKTEIWLIGQMSPTLVHTKLSSRKEMMALFFYYKQEKNKTIREACNSTADDVLHVWALAHIPTQKKCHVADKIEDIFKEWQKLKKNKENKAKRSEGLEKKEKEWQGTLDNLFDIAHAKALKIITIEEDRAFLLAQRQRGRPGKIGNTDTALAKVEERSQRRAESQQRLVEKEKDRRNRLVSATATLASSSSEEKEDEDEGNDPIYPVCDYEEPSTSTAPPPKRRKLKIVDETLAASLDVAKLSDRKASQILIPTIQFLGQDPSNYNVSYSTVRRERIKQRKKIAEGLKKQFKPEVPLTIHWDGKLLEDISGHEVVDRLPVLVSGHGVDQLLGVPKLPSGTGKAAASAICDLAVEWGVCDRVKCMGFDTTAVNTGHRSGVCILLEQKMDKDMLWLACRHHIFELVLQAVVEQCLGPSTGPDILIFKRFRQEWPQLNHEDYQTSASDDTVSTAVSALAGDIIAFAQDQLQEFHPRNDYRELLELVIVFLGGTLAKRFSVKFPAGLHRARWMAKAIYSLKIWMFRTQFKLTKREEKSISSICIFVVKVYLRVWFTAPSASSAPRNDLQMLKLLSSYKDNPVVAKVALKKFMGHLWYLSEELSAFAFFDDQVTTDTKRKMVQALDRVGDEHPLKRAIVDQDPTVISTKNLEDFVSSNTRRFFELTDLPSDFLRLDAGKWEEEEEYIKVKKTVQCMRVVNDIAERGVALISEYNKLHTTNEEQKQYLLLVVKDYRKNNPDQEKSTLKK